MTQDHEGIINKTNLGGKRVKNLLRQKGSTIENPPQKE